MAPVSGACVTGIRQLSQVPKAETCEIAVAALVLARYHSSCPTIPESHSHFLPTPHNTIHTINGIT